MVLRTQLRVHGFLPLWISFAVSKADVQEKETETEADEVFWNTRIAPILHQLEKGNRKSFCFKLRTPVVISMFPIALIFLVCFDYHFCEHVQKQMKLSLYSPSSVRTKYM